MLTPGILSTEPAEVPDPPVVVVRTPWRTVREAASYCRCRPATLERAAKNGKVRSSGGGQGKPRMFRDEWLDEYMEHHR